MKTFEEFQLKESFRGTFFIRETELIKKVFKPYEKYGSVKVVPPDIEDGEDFFNVIVECKYPLNSYTIDYINKGISSKLTFSDSNSKVGSCEVGALRGDLYLEFFVDIPKV